MDYSTIKPKKSRAYIQYFKDGVLIATYKRKRITNRYHFSATRRQFESTLSNSPTK